MKKKDQRKKICVIDICTVQDSRKFKKQKGVKSCLSFLRFLNFLWVLLSLFITAYDVAKMNTCLLGLWTFPHHNRCYVNSVEFCPEHFCVFILFLFLPTTCRSLKLQPLVARWGVLAHSSRSHLFLSQKKKTISYHCILPNYLKQTVGYAGSQITKHTHIHTHKCIHVYYTHRKKNSYQGSVLSSAVYLSWACGACYAYIESLRGGKGGFN